MNVAPSGLWSKAKGGKEMRIGEYDVELMNLGRFGMDGGGMFGIVPKALWTRAYPHVDAENRVELVTWALLIRGRGRIIVADAGVGDKLEPKRGRQFALAHEPRSLERALKARGVEPEEVTDFIYTHLHFDHAGGATRWGTPMGRDGGGADSAGVPVMPHARHCVQSRHLDWARQPSDKDRASFLPENWEPVVSAGLLDEVDGPVELLPGIELRPVNGHTPAMQMIAIHGNSEATDGSAGLLFAVDLVPTAAHLPAHYIAAFDNEPLVVLEEKRRLLTEAAERRWTVCFGHDPFTPAATLFPGSRGFEVEQVMSL